MSLLTLLVVLLLLYVLTNAFGSGFNPQVTNVLHFVALCILIYILLRAAGVVHGGLRLC